MNMNTIDFGFKRVEITPTRRSKHAGEIWIERIDKRMSRVCISADLCEEFKLNHGDKIELCESADKKMLAFKKVTHSASFEAKKVGHICKINSSVLAMNIWTHTRVNYHKEALVFEGKVVGEYLIFTPKEETDEQK